MMGGVVRTVDVKSAEAKNNIKAQEAIQKEKDNIKQKLALDFEGVMEKSEGQKK